MSGTFEGVSTLQFTPDNKYAFAFSGKVTRSATGTDNLLVFETGSEYLVSNIQVCFGGVRINDDFQANILLNDITVAEETYNNNYEMASPQYFKMIIPPFTTVKIQVEKQTGTSTLESFAFLRAKVKGAIEQVDLEAITDGSKWADQ